ncbi:MAG TPA: glycosyltransferase family 87 protein [Pirellulales bacterium]|jgi:hypothetical protein|nr:glycosyltransferase family 87 protein [Pirellulales bacterium]
MSKSERLKLLTLIVLIGFGSSVCIHYCRAGYGNLPYPATTWLCKPHDRFDAFAGGTENHYFGDFYVTWAQSHDPNPYRPSSVVVPSNYFPFTHILFKPLAAIPYNAALPLFLIGTLVGISAYLAWTLRVDDRLDNLKNVFVLCVMSYPVQMVVDRGNIEGLLFLLIAAFVACMQRGKVGWSVVALSCAAAMKLYPGLFALMYLARRQYQAFAGCCVLTLLLSVSSLAVFDGGIVANARDMLGVLRTCDASADTGTHVVQHGSSFHGMLRSCGFLLGAREEPIAVFNRLNLLFSLATLGLLLAAHLRCRLKSWESCALITFAIVLVPKVSFDYKLVLLYLPLALFMNSYLPRRAALLYTLGFALMLVPKGFMCVRDDVSIGCIIGPLVMIAMACAILVSAYWPSRAAQAIDREALPNALATSAR